MSASPSEPEKFSIDEMLERLSDHDSPTPAPLDGTLVTRSDGTQAIKVRKRKRRSEQPQKDAIRKKQHVRNFQIAAVVVLVFILCLILGGTIIYSNSRPFRDGLITKITEATGATVDLRQFRINPETANAGQMTLNWPADKLVKSLKLGRIQATISPTSLFGQSFNGDEVTAAESTLELSFPNLKAQATNSTPDTSKPKIQFERFRSPDFSAILGDSANPVIHLTKSEASFDPVSTGKRPQVTLYKGKLAIAGWQDLRLDRALLEMKGREIEVISLKLLSATDNKGEFQLTGTVTPFKSSSPSTLAVTLNAFDLTAFLGPTLGKIFNGKVDTQPSSKSNFLSFFPDSSSSPTLDITFQADPSSTVELQKIPFLSAFARLLADPWFESPTFETEASGIIHQDNQITTLKNLNLESKARMAIRGTISTGPSATTSGTLQVGLAEGIVLSSVTNRFSQLFGPVKDGYRWVNLTINGTEGQLTDNFEELFSALQDEAQRSPSERATQPSSFRELTK